MKGGGWPATRPREVASALSAACRYDANCGTLLPTRTAPSGQDQTSRNELQTGIQEDTISSFHLLQMRGGDNSSARKTKSSLVIHHIDENPSNNDPSNWAPAHGSCHNRFHRLGARAEDKTKDKLSKANLGKKLSEETRSKISASLVGNTHTKGRSLTQEHKGKIGNAHSGMKRSDEAKANIRAGILRRRQDVH